MTVLAAITRRLARYRQRGLAKSGRILVDTAALHMLRWRYGFDRWHAASPTSARPYRRGLAALVSGVRPKVVVEVGCGLGAVLARVDAAERVGYDSDPAVVRAARALRSGIRFEVGGFDAITEPRIDVLIAVNWPHDFAPEQLAAWLLPLLPRTSYLLLDRIEPSSPLSYRHFHDFAFLEGRADLVRAERFGEAHRQFLLYKVAP